MSLIFNQLLTKVTPYRELSELASPKSPIAKTSLKVAAIALTILTLGIATLFIKGVFWAIETGQRLNTRVKVQDPHLKAQDPCGIPNLGASCFLNSSIQLLKFMPGIEEFLNLPLNQKPGENQNRFDHRKALQSDLKDLITELKKANPSAVTIEAKVRDVGNNPCLKSRFPHMFEASDDVNLFLNALLDRLDSNLSIKHNLKLFRIGINDPATCPYQAVQNISGLSSVPCDQENAVSMQALVDFNFKPDSREFYWDFALHCDDLSSLTSIIMNVSRRDGTANKCVKQVTNTLLPIQVWVNNQRVNLEPVSIVCHHGQCVDDGHYTIFVKQDNGTWKEYDDKESRILEATKADEIIRSNSCLINYKLVR